MTATADNKASMGTFKSSINSSSILHSTSWTQQQWHLRTRNPKIQNLQESDCGAQFKNTCCNTCSLRLYWENFLWGFIELKQHTDCVLYVQWNTHMDTDVPATLSLLEDEKNDRQRFCSVDYIEEISPEKN
jgi:hypothetical protein